MQFKFKINDTVRTVFVEKTINEYGSNAVKVYFYHDDNEEQSVEFGFTNEADRDEYWQELHNIDKAMNCCDGFLTKVGDVVTKAESYES